MLGAWLKRLETQHPKAMDLGLDRLREVWRALGAPWPGAQVVTVAGTNGKGSAVAASGPGSGPGPAGGGHHVAPSSSLQ